MAYNPYAQFMNNMPLGWLGMNSQDFTDTNHPTLSKVAQYFEGQANPQQAVNPYQQVSSNPQQQNAVYAQNNTSGGGGVQMQQVPKESNPYNSQQAPQQTAQVTAQVTPVTAQVTPQQAVNPYSQMIDTSYLDPNDPKTKQIMAHNKSVEQPGQVQSPYAQMRWVGNTLTNLSPDALSQTTPNGHIAESVYNQATQYDKQKAQQDAYNSQQLAAKPAQDKLLQAQQEAEKMQKLKNKGLLDVANVKAQQSLQAAQDKINAKKGSANGSIQDLKSNLDSINSLIPQVSSQQNIGNNPLFRGLEQGTNYVARKSAGMTPEQQMYSSLTAQIPFNISTILDATGKRLPAVEFNAIKQNLPNMNMSLRDRESSLAAVYDKLINANNTNGVTTKDIPENIKPYLYKLNPTKYAEYANNSTASQETDNSVPLTFASMDELNNTPNIPKGTIVTVSGKQLRIK